MPNLWKAPRTRVGSNREHTRLCPSVLHKAQPPVQLLRSAVLTAASSLRQVEKLL
jgi:hypothetical protein